VFSTYRSMETVISRYLPLVIVDNFDVMGIPLAPDAAETPPIVNSDYDALSCPRVKPQGRSREALPNPAIPSHHPTVAAFGGRCVRLPENVGCVGGGEAAPSPHTETS
jgi:hypothetical protein